MRAHRQDRRRQKSPKILGQIQANSPYFGHFLGSSGYLHGVQNLPGSNCTMDYGRITTSPTSRSGKCEVPHKSQVVPHPFSPLTCRKTDNRNHHSHFAVPRSCKYDFAYCAVFFLFLMTRLETRVCIKQMYLILDLWYGDNPNILSGFIIWIPSPPRRTTHNGHRRCSTLCYAVRLDVMH